MKKSSILHFEKKEIVFLVIFFLFSSSIYLLTNNFSFGIMSGTQKEMATVLLLQTNNSTEHLWFNKTASYLSEQYSLFHHGLAFVTKSVNITNIYSMHIFYKYFPLVLLPFAIILVYMLCKLIFLKFYLSVVSTIGYFFLFDVFALTTFHLGRHLTLFLLLPIGLIFFILIQRHDFSLNINKNESPKKIIKKILLNTILILIPAIVLLLMFYSHMIYAAYFVLFIAGYTVFDLLLSLLNKIKYNFNKLLYTTIIIIIPIIFFLLCTHNALNSDTKLYFPAIYDQYDTYAANLFGMSVASPTQILAINPLNIILLLQYGIIIFCGILMLIDLLKKRNTLKDHGAIITGFSIFYPLILLFSPITIIFFKILSPGIAVGWLFSQPMFLPFSLTFAVYFIINYLINFFQISKNKRKINKIKIFCHKIFQKKHAITLISVTCILLILPNIAYTVYAASKISQNELNYFGQDTIQYLSTIPNQTILSDPISSYLIPVVSKDKVLITVDPFLIRRTSEDLAQIADVNEVYSDKTNSIKPLIDKYDIHYILVCDSFWDTNNFVKSASTYNSFYYSYSKTNFRNKVNTLKWKEISFNKCDMYTDK